MVKLGEGNFHSFHLTLGALGSVYKVQEKKTKTIYAMKKLVIEKYNAVAKRHYQNEVAALVIRLVYSFRIY